VWGNTDPFFLPAGAEAFKRDNPNAQVVFFKTGHFALETHSAEIGAKIVEFLPIRRLSAVATKGERA
jgi:pimeloyl-ACP methyl ester carboxylesterase